MCVCVFSLQVCAERGPQDALVSPLGAPAAALCADMVVHQERTGPAAALHQGNTGLHQSARQVALFQLPHRLGRRVRLGLWTGVLDCGVRHPKVRQGVCVCFRLAHSFIWFAHSSNPYLRLQSVFRQVFVCLVVILTSSILAIAYLVLLPLVLNTYTPAWIAWHLCYGHWNLIMIAFHYYKAAKTSPGYLPSVGEK